jgi:hypothetical protein
MLTTEELRACAIQAQEALHETGDPHNGDDWATMQVVKAWLADHPADDDEPVTTEWLAAVGITEDEGRANGDIYVCAWVGRWQHGRVEILIGKHWDQTYIPGGMTPQTRGEFRRLCAALGVPLTEAA